MEKPYNKYYNPKVQQKASMKYRDKNYQRIEFLVYKGQKEIIKEYAQSKGMSLNAYINSLIASDMGELLPEVKKEDKE